jgi:hypothetical protein
MIFGLVFESSLAILEAIFIVEFRVLVIKG